MIKCWVGLGGGGELALPTAVSWKFCSILNYKKASYNYETFIKIYFIFLFKIKV